MGDGRGTELLFYPFPRSAQKGDDGGDGVAFLSFREGGHGGRGSPKSGYEAEVGVDVIGDAEPDGEASSPGSGCASAITSMPTCASVSPYFREPRPLSPCVMDITPRRASSSVMAINRCIGRSQP